MGLFIISFLLVFVSSYLLTSLIAPRKSILGVIYLFLIAFAQLVLTFEVLSLFSAIKQFWVLGFNLFFCLSAGFVWYKKSKPIWSLDFKDFKNRVINSFKLDKSLIWLCVGFVVFLLASLILCLLMPITNVDAASYHVARSLFWVLNGNLNHFNISDIRALSLPINSEILYAWILLFIKKDVFLGFFSFVGYLMSVISIYGILGFLGYCTRKRLWVIFILSSFSSVIVQVSSTETDLIIAGLVSSSLFLFWYALRADKKIPLYMASLAYAIAIGTKTTSILAIPGMGLFLFFLTLHFKKKEFYKSLGLFLLFGAVNFLIFSSYNYILNLVHFSYPMGAESLMQITKNPYGIKAIPANFIKYIFLFFDFTGFRWSDYVGKDLMNFRDILLNFLHLGYIKDGVYTVNFGVNRSLLEPLMGAGILGFLVYLPCLAWAFIKPVFSRKSTKLLFILGFAGIFIVNLLVLSYLLAFMAFSIRFLMFFMVLSSPILVYSYLGNKNPLKYLIIAFSLFYLMAVSTHLWARPLNKIIFRLIETPSITALRERAACKDYEKDGDYFNSACLVARKIRNNYTNDDKILVFSSVAENIYLLKALEFEGYTVDFDMLENIKNIDLDKYNLIVTTNQGQSATVIKDYEKRKNEVTVNGERFSNKKGNTVPCIYLSNPTRPSFKYNPKFPPYESHCGMTQEFLNEKHLKMEFIAGIVFAGDVAEDLKYYIIYKNTNRPLKFKKGS